MAGRRFLSHGRRLFLISLTGLWLGACADQDFTEPVMPNESLSGSCKTRVIPNQYVVYWKDGRISRVSFSSREELKEEFVKPKLEELRKVENDIRFDLNDFKIKPDTTYNTNYGFGYDNWGYKNTEAEVAWQNNIRGENVLVAVIDSGVDITHPLLQNRIYTNPGEAGAKANNGIDDDGNGYVDDVHGFDFIQDRATYSDDIGHGTHVAGIIAAEHNETAWTQQVLLSVAPRSVIMPLKFIDSMGGTLGGALEAMDYAGRMGVKIINASWGGEGCSQIMQDKIVELGNKGILFVAASGNNGNNLEVLPEYPAAFVANTQITVGSITEFNGMSNFSNYSENLVHLFAPGSEIVSTYTGGGTQMLSGTSMATPFVAGAAALVAGVHPEYTPVQIKNALLNSVIQSGAYANKSHGRLNIKKLVESL